MQWHSSRRHRLLRIAPFDRVVWLAAQAPKNSEPTCGTNSPSVCGLSGQKNSSLAFLSFFLIAFWERAKKKKCGVRSFFWEVGQSRGNGNWEAKGTSELPHVFSMSSPKSPTQLWDEETELWPVTTPVNDSPGVHFKPLPDSVYSSHAKIGAISRA